MPILLIIMRANLIIDVVGPFSDSRDAFGWLVANNWQEHGMANDHDWWFHAVLDLKAKVIFPGKTIDPNEFEGKMVAMHSKRQKDQADAAQA
jgi:hypothetical protein